MMNESPKASRSGFVCLLGRPSSGKSSLINHVCQYPVSIVSSYPQTTLKVIKGIYSDSRGQAIFLDTPGYYEKGGEYHTHLVNHLQNSLKDADVILYCLDSTRDIGLEEKKIWTLLEQSHKPVVSVLTKTDLPLNTQVAQFLKTTTEQYYSVSQQDQQWPWMESVFQNLPEHPYYYPENWHTDQNLEFWLTEQVRQQLFYHLNQEVPYQVYVNLHHQQQAKQGLNIYMDLYVAHECQKAIVIGQQARNIRRIRQKAQRTIAEQMKKNIRLFLTVKLHRNWNTDHQFLSQYLKKV